MWICNQQIIVVHICYQDASLPDDPVVPSPPEFSPTHEKPSFFTVAPIAVAAFSKHLARLALLPLPTHSPPPDVV